VQLIEYSPWDLDYDDPNDAPVCVCPEYHGTTEVTFCKACGAYTDTLELLAAFDAEVAAAIDAFAGRKPQAHAEGVHAAAAVRWARS
jgi:hypothetical protein